MTPELRTRLTHLTIAAAAATEAAADPATRALAAAIEHLTTALLTEETPR